MIPTVQLGLHIRAGAAQSPPADDAQAAAPGFLAELATQEEKPLPKGTDADASLFAGLLGTVPQAAPQPADHASLVPSDTTALVASDQDPAPPHAHPTPQPGVGKKPLPGWVEVSGVVAPMMGAQAVPASGAAPEPTPQGDSLAALAAVPVNPQPAEPAAERVVPVLETPAPAETRVFTQSDAKNAGPQASLPDNPTPEITARALAAVSHPDQPTRHAEAANTSLKAGTITETMPRPQQAVAQMHANAPAPDQNAGRLAPAPQAPGNPTLSQPASVILAPTQPSAVAAATPVPARPAHFAVAPLETSAEQTTQADAAPPPARMSPAESAWQTFLQRDVRPVPQPVPQLEGPASQQQPTIAAPDADTLQALPPAQRVATFAAADNPPQTNASPVETTSPLDTAKKPAPDHPVAQPVAADTGGKDTAANPAPTPVQTVAPAIAAVDLPPLARLDHIAPSAPPPLSHHLATQAAPHLPAALSAQLLHHSADAKTSGVDVLLQPEELGHVKFQIQQHGDNVRILLSAERPETVELLRRNADQLLQEFRQSGFSQASLSFGQWGDQQRAPAPPAASLAQLETDGDAPISAPRPPQPSAPILATGRGLNLRL